jgi:hypothetical protein
VRVQRRLQGVCERWLRRTLTRYTASLSVKTFSLDVRAPDARGLCGSNAIFRKLKPGAHLERTENTAFDRFTFLIPKLPLRCK